LKITCRHGFFIFEESRGGELGEFTSLYGLELAARGRYFTFADLVDAPDFSIKGLTYLNLPGKKTFAGEPWEIFEANEWIYNYDTGKLAPIASITNVVTLYQTGTYFFSEGLILPGSVTADGSRVKDYAAWFSSDSQKFKYSEVNFVD
jgi:hypothetical protein